MRIAIINERWTAGATRCARDLQRGLSTHHTVAYFPEGPVPSPREYLDQLAGFLPDVVNLHSYFGDLPYSFLADVANRYPVVYTIHDPRPIGNILLPCWNCDAYGSCFKCPIIGSPKRYTLFRHNFFWSRRAKQKVHRRLPSNTTVVCVSDWMRSRVAKTELARLGVKRIYNGIDSSAFRPDPNARAVLGLPEAAKVVTFVAHHSGWTVDERKGVPILARALSEIVIPRFPELIVLAVGGGMIPNLPNIRPIGFVSPQQVAQYYSAADIFVAPSLADNLPYTILEAMACDIPVVASRIGGIPEEVVDWETGRLCKPGSWQELGAALIQLLENPAQAKVMGQAGGQRIREHFEMSTFLSQYESVFEANKRPNQL